MQKCYQLQPGPAVISRFQQAPEVTDLRLEDVLERPVEDLDVVQWSAQCFNLELIRSEIIELAPVEDILFNFDLTLTRIW